MPDLSDSRKSRKYIISEKRRKRNIAVIYACILAVTFLISAFFIFFALRYSKHKSYKAVTGFMEAFINLDADSLCEFLDGKAADSEDIKSSCEATFNEIKNREAVYKISYEIKTVEKADKSTVKSINDTLYSSADVVKKAYAFTVNVKSVVEYEGQKNVSTSSLSLISYKKDKKWYITGFTN